MYDCTAKPTAAGKEVPQCHNLHVTVKKLTTRSLSNNTAHSVQVPITQADDFIRFDIEETCSPSESGLTQLAMQDLEFSEVCAELTGCFDQGRGLPSLAVPGAWDSDPERQPTMSDANNMHFHKPLLTTLPLPSSHAYLEPTFSRRLVRLLWEYAFNVLTGPHTPPTQVDRCFGFCLRYRTKETLINKFKAYLGLSTQPVSALDRQAWNTAPDVRDSRDATDDEWDYWLEAGKVELYLGSLGFSLSENGEKVGLGFAPVVLQDEQAGMDAISLSSAKDETQPTPQIPYGSKWQPSSCITNTLFDDNGNFHVPASWLASSALETVTPENPTCLNAERLVQQDSRCYLDVNRFFAGLIDVSVCLGRAAGFRRVDVDGVLKRCLVKL